MKKQIAIILGLVLSVSMLAGCGNNSSQNKTKEQVPVQEEPAPAPQEESSEEVSLSDWEDVHKKWNSIATFYDKDYLLAEAEEHAKEDGTTVEAILSEHEEGSHSDIAVIEFDGNKITLMDKEGKELASSEYKYVETIGKGEDHGEFSIFEATGQVPAQFKALALMEPHGGEGDITHFHLRYADSTDSPDLTDENWWPVFVDPASTEDQVINEILGHEH